MPNPPKCALFVPLEEQEETAQSPADAEVRELDDQPPRDDQYLADGRRKR